MKLKAILIAGASLITLGQAATTSYSNLLGFDSTTNAVVSATGSAISSGTGFVGIGFFTGLDDTALIASIDASVIAADFTAFSSSAFNGPADGLYDSGTVANADTAFNGKVIYTVIGNGDTIATSTQLLIAKHTISFAADPAITPGAVLSDSAGGNVTTLLKGNFGLFTSDFGAGSNAAYSLSILVPEPSVALLGAVSGLGLLRRKRI